ncbi:unnamed protein product [Auanema sp. JU1783]|nr:unnamed protein product [Auanema sp. JU1783]
MVLPTDSEFVLKQRIRRHVICGRTVRNRKQAPFVLNYEQRAVCPYRHITNRNSNRVPEILEEVVCECDRPSHLSPYTEIRCQPVKYRMPVLYKDETTHEFIASHEELTLACIPLVPKEDDDSFEIQPLN